MEMTTINAETLQKMFIAGAKNLEAKKEWINELNVFPVPDGDTGTNMTLTIMSAAKEVGAITEPTMETIAKAISTGSLRGARGNSGVILSQLFRGFTREIKKVDQIDVDVLSRACVKAVETAYKAVMKPKEGTILTVAKGMADKSCELVGESDDLVHVIDEIIKHGDYVLSQTPEMLPVLKQAGVVDSGGQGLMTVIKGAFDALLRCFARIHGRSCPRKRAFAARPAAKTAPFAQGAVLSAGHVEHGDAGHFSEHRQRNIPVCQILIRYQTGPEQPKLFRPCLRDT